MINLFPLQILSDCQVESEEGKTCEKKNNEQYEWSGSDKEKKSYDDY